ncbi:MAG: hypothetical protein M4579_002189 [Chaenotheca gracillima]|nr:MAG: hypothetical protein M4579_002189 [Chaenotheca gracillima]
MQLLRAARVILVGAPGVGKGTQTERLLKRYPQLSAINSGDILRENVRTKTPLGVKAESTMNAGSLVPDDVMVKLILSNLESRGWLHSAFTEEESSGSSSTLPSEDATGSLESIPNDSDAPTQKAEPYTLNATSTDPISLSADRSPASVQSASPAIPWMPAGYNPQDNPDTSFILDGFPRTAAQASRLDENLSINLVVQLLTPTSTLLDRICNRLVHAPSGRVYNTTFNPPKVEGKDDVTGEPLTRRKDDDPETWKARLRKFEDTSRPLLEHYGAKGCLWTVKGDSSDEISPKLFREFERRFCQEA